MAGGDRKNADSALVAALAAGLTVPKAAEQAGVSERTVYRRLKDGDFRAKVDQARTEAVSRTVGKLADLGTEAVDGVKALANSATSESVKLGALRTILEYLLRGHEQYTLARQVEELKKQIDEVKGGASRTETGVGQSKPGGGAAPSDGQSRAGEGASGPGSPLPPGGDGARPVADGPSPFEFYSDAPPLQPPMSGRRHGDPGPARQGEQDLQSP
jgi:hypothetical protein